MATTKHPKNSQSAPQNPQNPNKTAPFTPPPPVHNLSITCQQNVNNPKPPKPTYFKLRIPTSLYARATACSDAVHTPLARWLRLALSHHAATDERIPAIFCATEPRTIASIEHPTPNISPIDHLTRIARAVAFCESRRPKPFSTNLREGVDYLVANQTE
jgi:hypothetical protein